MDWQIVINWCLNALHVDPGLVMPLVAWIIGSGGSASQVVTFLKALFHWTPTPLTAKVLCFVFSTIIALPALLATHAGALVYIMSIVIAGVIGPFWHDAKDAVNPLTPPQTSPQRLAPMEQGISRKEG